MGWKDSSRLALAITVVAACIAAYIGFHIWQRQVIDYITDKLGAGGFWVVAAGLTGLLFWSADRLDRSRGTGRHRKTSQTSTRHPQAK